MNNIQKVLYQLNIKKQVDEAELKESIPALRTVINQIRKKGHLILRVFDGKKFYFIYKGLSNEQQQQKQSEKTSRSI